MWVCSGEVPAYAGIDVIIAPDGRIAALYLFLTSGILGQDVEVIFQNKAHDRILFEVSCRRNVPSRSSSFHGFGWLVEFRRLCSHQLPATFLPL